MTVPPVFGVRLDRDVLRVVGPDTAGYLQGQLSQDVEALTVGASAFTLLLEPDGKLGYWLRMTREADDAVLLDIDGGWGEPLRARLERFKLRMQAEIEPLDWSCVALRGELTIGLSGRVATFDWPGLSGVDLLGPDVGVPPGIDEITPAHYESLRIAAGIPRMGAELTEGRIPAETGVVDASVSFTKGCYTGQELVARIDSRGGNVPRRLRRLLVDGPPPAAGAEVLVDGAPVGEVTSAAPWSDDTSKAVALGYVKRSVEAPSVGSVGGASATIDDLPTA